MSRIFFFGAAVFIFILRLGIWKFFPGLGSNIKNDLSDAIIASLVFGLAIVFWARKAWRAQASSKSGLEGPLALFIAIAAASLSWTADVGASVRALVMLVAHVLFFYMLLDLLREEQWRRLFLWVFFIAAVVVACLGIQDIVYLSNIPAQAIESARLTNNSLYYILTHKRACSVFGWPNVLAGFLMLAMPLSAALFLSARQMITRGAVIIGAIILVTAFFFTFSFLGWTIFLATSGGLLIFLVRTKVLALPLFLSRYGMVLGIIIAVLFGGVIIKKDLNGSMVPRKEYARVAATVIGDHPVRGVGFGAYKAASLKYVHDLQGMTAFPHNTYVQVWAETGLAGLVAILWLVFVCVRAAIARLRRMADGMPKVFFITTTISLFAFFIDNVTSFTMLKPNIAFFFWVWLAVFLSYSRPDEVILSVKVAARRALATGLVLASMVGLVLSTTAAVSLLALRDGNDLLRQGDFSRAHKAFETSIRVDPLNTMALSMQGNLYLQGFQARKEPVFLDLAQESFLQAAGFSPYDHYNYLALASICNMRGDAPGVQAWLARAIAVSPYEAKRDIQAFSQRK